jgi:hypothetical protein
MLDKQDVYWYKNVRCFDNVWVHLLVFMWYSWEFYCRQLRTFGRTVETCIRLLPNSCPTALCSTLYEFLAQDKGTVIAQPLHSPHLVPCDFFVSPKFEIALMWRRINDVSMISHKIAECLYRVSSDVLHRMFWMVAQSLSSLYKSAVIRQ